MPTWIRLANKISARSNHPIHQVGAVFVRGGNVISCANNYYRYGRHAEIRAMKRLDVRGATVYVARNGGGLMSRPCDNCYEALKAAGVETMVYFDWDGKITKEKV